MKIAGKLTILSALLVGLPTAVYFFVSHNHRLAGQPQTLVAQGGPTPAYTITFQNYAACGKDKAKQPIGRLHIVAQRANGDHVELYEKSGPVLHRIRKLNSVGASGRVGTLVDDAAMTKSTFALRPRLGRDPASDCTTAKDGTLQTQTWRPQGRENILGVETIRGVTKGRDETEISWLAPSLGCASVKSEVVKTKTGEFIASIEPLSIETGEPAETLFIVGAGYRELPYSDFAVEGQRRIIQGLGETLSPEEEQKIRNNPVIKHQDRAYHIRRP